MHRIWLGKDEQSARREERHHVYLDCAGRPLAVLHQLDRKHARYVAWRRSFKRRFDGVYL
jgi:hypothetical protein